MQVKVNIELEGGKKINHYQHLRLDQWLFTHHRFELEVPFYELEDKDEHFFRQAHQDVCGKMITLSFKPTLKKEAKEFIFRGLVTEINLKNHSTLANSFVLRGYSLDYLLEDGTQRRVFATESLQQVFEKVLKEYPQNVLRRKLQPRRGSSQGFEVQYDESNFAFLNRLAAKHGEWFFYNGRELQLGLESGGTQDFLIDGVQTFDLSITLHPSKFRMKSYNPVKHQHLDSQSSGQSVDGQGTFGEFALKRADQLFGREAQRFSPRNVVTQSQLDGIVKAVKSVEATKAVTFNGRGENPELGVGTVINVIGTKVDREGKFSKENFGKFRVTEVTHSVDGNGNYANTFRAVPESAESPPPNPYVSAPLGNPELAEVSDNDDPEKLGRVKVRYYWADQAHAESDWMRVTTPYCGEGYGLVFTPEIGAQVLVGYEANLAECPVVMGSLYHQRSDHQYTQPNNARKWISTRDFAIGIGEAEDQHELFFNRYEGLKKVDDTFLYIKFDKNGQIELKTDGTLSLEGKTVKIKGESIQVSAGSSFVVESDQGKIELKANELKVEGRLGLELKSDTQLKASALTVSLKADTMLEAKGTPIMLN